MQDRAKRSYLDLVDVQDKVEKSVSRDRNPTTSFRGCTSPKIGKTDEELLPCILCATSLPRLGKDPFSHGDRQVQILPISQPAYVEV